MQQQLLDELVSLGSPSSVPALFKLFEPLLSNPVNPTPIALNSSGIPAIFSHIQNCVSSSDTNASSRQMLVELANPFFKEVSNDGDATAHKIYQVEEKYSDWVPYILLFALSLMASRQVSFEEPISVLRERLATYYETQEEWLISAQMLNAIPLDSGHRIISNRYKLNILLKICQLYLELEDHVSAETYLNRASVLIGKVTSEESEKSKMNMEVLTYRVCFVRILDYKRKFIEAASKYHELATLMPTVEEQILCLQQASVCTILANAGIPQRARLLGLLYKDERLRNVALSDSDPSSKQSLIFQCLEKVYNQSIIRREMIEALSKHLPSHYLAILSDKSTVLERSILEHNFLSVSRRFDSIRIDEMARLVLGTDNSQKISAEQEEKVEETAARMIDEGRLESGTFIDRSDRFIYFKKPDPFTLLDSKIKKTCQALEDLPIK